MPVIRGGPSTTLRMIGAVNALKVAGTIALTIGLAACSNATIVNQRAPSTASPISVATTISTLNSFVTGVGGSRVRVQSIVPIGASPETFQPTPQSVEMVSDAQLIVENGAGLETWMHGLLANARPSAKVVDCSAGLPVKGSNPHLWMDPVYAKDYVAAIRDALSSLDPRHRAEYARNAAAYDARLDTLIAWIRAQVAPIPRSRRVLIVFHNAWQYYDDRFGIRTLGIIETAPGQEPNPQDFGRTVDLAKRYRVGAIFGEPEYSPKLAIALAHDAGVPVVEDLYDDSIGTNPEVSNYIAMLHYDTRELVKSMK
jgi:zinc/manganese transport system substrate-binding protein